MILISIENTIMVKYFLLFYGRNEILLWKIIADIKLRGPIGTQYTK